MYDQFLQTLGTMLDCSIVISQAIIRGSNEESNILHCLHHVLSLLVLLHKEPVARCGYHADECDILLKVTLRVTISVETFHQLVQGLWVFEVLQRYVL